MGVCREDGETDERYKHRCELFDILYANAVDTAAMHSDWQAVGNEIMTAIDRHKDD